MNELSTFAGRYHLAASPDWQALLTLFDLNEGFAFVVLLVRNEEGAEVCREALGRRLADTGKELLIVETAPPTRLERVAEALLPDAAPAGTGAVWVERVVSEGAPDYAEWREAWRRGVAALNQHRNPFRRKWNVPVIFAGAPWLQEVLRENAPDLWSVRTQVVWVEPEPGESPVGAIGRDIERKPRRGPDPEMALAQAERLRGRPGAEALLARMLYRAGLGFAAQSRWPEAVQAFEASLAIRPADEKDLAELAETHLSLGRSLTWVENYSRANAHMDHALALFRQAGELLREAASISGLGDIALLRSDYAVARRRYEEALQLFRQGAFLRGEANCIRRLGDIATFVSDFAEARRRYTDALHLYTAIPEPYSIGWTHMTLARLTSGAERAQHVQAARQAFLGIGRADLVQFLHDEFESNAAT